MGSFVRGRRLGLPLVGAAIAIAAVTGVANASSGATATPIKIGIMSDCKGAFGSFDAQDQAGVFAALSQYAGAKPKDPNDPRKGITGGSIAGHPIKIVGVGCGSDNADLAISETRRLMEQDGADIEIGPLSGDESVAIANYAKQHPTQTFVDGSAGAQDTTLKVRAPNFFRFNGDGAQWNAGLGDLAYHKLGWKTAAVVADNYSFGWTSAAGFIAEFCAVGGKVTQRVFPPLNTTDYSTYAQQLKTNVDGTFVAVGGSGLIPFLKAYEQAHGPIDSKKFIGNLFWGTPGEFESLSTDVSGAYVGGAGTAGDLNTAGGEELREQHHRQVVQADPAGWRRRPAGIEHVHVRLLHQHVGPDQGPAGGQGRPLRRPEGAAEGAREGRPQRPVRRRQARRQPSGDPDHLLPAAVHQGRQAGSQDGRRGAGRDADLRRHVLHLHAGPGADGPEVREALPAVGRQGDPPQGHLVARKATR